MHDRMEIIKNALMAKLSNSYFLTQYTPDDILLAAGLTATDINNLQAQFSSIIEETAMKADRVSLSDLQ